MQFFQNKKRLYIIGGTLIFIILLSFLLCLNLRKKKKEISNKEIELVDVTLNNDNTSNKKVNKDEFDKKDITNKNNNKVEDKVEKIYNEFYVEIKGAVKKPGVYKVNENNIINDLIKLAGGLNKNSYTNNINLSKKLQEEMVVYVFNQNEIKEKVKKEKINNCICNSYEIDECIKDNETIIIPDNNKLNEDINNKDNTIKNEPKNEKININNASLDELINLSGIGPEKAKDIIEYRKSYPFEKIDDLKKVHGIGEATFDKIKEFITV